MQFKLWFQTNEIATQNWGHEDAPDPAKIAASYGGGALPGNIPGTNSLPPVNKYIPMRKRYVKFPRISK
jgi:hypothetical protein